MCLYQPTFEMPSLLTSIFPRVCDRPNDLSNNQPTKLHLHYNSLQTRRIKWDGSEYKCTCRSHAMLKLQSEICKIERGIAEVTSFMILVAFRMPSFCCHLLMGDGLGNATYTSIVSCLQQCLLSTPNFTLIGNEHFEGCRANAVSKCKKSFKTVLLADILARSSRITKGRITKGHI